MRVLVTLITFALLLGPDGRGLAWNKPGHMVSAAIAYVDLRERNPDALKAAVRVLSQHPQLDSLWALKLKQVPEDLQDLRLLMLAARWPDDIRGDEDYDHPNWHFVNIPFTPGAGSGPIPRTDSILTAFAESRSIAASPDAGDEERAVALCWILHLIGDIHQPLHTTKLVSADYPEPEGDRGGNRFFIRVKPGRMTVSLHKFWDDLVMGSERFRSVWDKAAALMRRPGLNRAALADQLAEKEFSDWALASHALAIREAYRNGTLPGTNRHDDGAPLPEGYKDAARKIAERGVALAGFRISDELIRIFGPDRGVDEAKPPSDRRHGR